MSKFNLILQSLLHYKKANLTIILGVAISSMVLTGTLIVGDSVDHSLTMTAELRLGNVGYSFSSIDRYFRIDLAKEVQEELKIPVASIMQVKGIASSQGGQMRVNNIDVQGIDSNFLNMVPGNQLEEIPGRNEAFISQNLADRLGLKIDDSFLLRVEKVSLIPKNAPFISDDENQVSIRLTVRKILTKEKLGRFNLKTSQTAPFNVFLSLEYLNNRMETEGKANKLLLGNGTQYEDSYLLSVISKNWRLEDSGLKISLTDDKKEWNIESNRVFIDSVIVNAIYKFEDRPSLILTYLANSLEKKEQETPYSFVSAGPFFDGQEMDSKDIIINSWLAEDLDARVGDSLLLKFYSIGPLRQLVENKQWFIVQKVVPLSGRYADRKLMPTLPGLSDAGSCRDWETGIPIDLEKIRDKDEEYWNEWKGTPKAYISYSEGKKIWQNRFGACTLIRLDAAIHGEGEISENLLKYHGPEDLGFQLRNLKQQGMEAAQGGVDFSELFFGMSFFLLIAGLTLLALLFNIHLENRMSQFGTLKALGYSDRLIRRLVISETAIVVFSGVLLGSIMAIWYNRLIFKALNTVWSAIVRTSVLAEDIRYGTILMGIIISFILVFLTVFFNINRRLKSKPLHLQKALNIRRNKISGKYLNWIAWLIFIISSLLILKEILSSSGMNPGIFFLSGGLILLAFILFSSGFLFKENESLEFDLSIPELSLRNLQRNKARSLRIIILFALGTFVIVSTGLNRKDLYSDAMNNSSGTGGFLFYGETTMPVLHDLNNPSTKVDLNLSENTNFVQMRKTEGDDASCLNLNRISQPRILGIPSEKLIGRFSFIKTSGDFESIGDWSALKFELPGGVVPAIADQTVIQWGLGLAVGDTLVYTDEYGNEMYVKLIGGLANSIFQGNILIDEELFLKHFPSSSGIHVFLVETDSDSLETFESSLKRSFRNTGLELVYTADRLAEFNSVENTYLSIFLLLGGLGMILGTVGLGLSLIRNIQDRLQELGILRAVGFRKNQIMGMLTREHIILLGFGTLIGTVGAFVATIPSVFSEYIDASWQTALVIIFIIMINGFLWIYLIGRISLRKDLLESLRTE